MTREEAISDAIHYARHRNSDSLIESCINDIFNDHEAQLKAKDNAYSKVAYDFESAVMEIAKKDEEIERLKAEYML